mgnify:CR=1 FL=1
MRCVSVEGVSSPSLAAGVRSLSLALPHSPLMNPHVEAVRFAAKKVVHYSPARPRGHGAEWRVNASVDHNGRSEGDCSHAESLDGEDVDAPADQLHEVSSDEEEILATEASAGGPPRHVDDDALVWRQASIRMADTDAAVARRAVSVAPQLKLPPDSPAKAKDIAKRIRNQVKTSPYRWKNVEVTYLLLPLQSFLPVPSPGTHIIAASLSSNPAALAFCVP